ncbi:rluD [Symbiodinium sp. CCMP2592]|nr:rluD [Symbiodinium sp. CCMP2592]
MAFPLEAHVGNGLAEPEEVIMRLSDWLSCEVIGSFLRQFPAKHRVEAARCACRIGVHCLWGWTTSQKQWSLEDLLEVTASIHPSFASNGRAVSPRPGEGTQRRPATADQVQAQPWAAPRVPESSRSADGAGSFYSSDASVTMPAWATSAPTQAAVQSGCLLRADTGGAQDSAVWTRQVMSGSRDEERPRLERFDGSDPASYRKWRRRAELMLLALPSTVSKDRWGPKLCEYLTGEAEEACEGITVAKLTGDDGYKLIFEVLDSRYGDLEQDVMQKYLSEFFFKTQIKAGESYRNLTIRADTAYRNLQEVGVKLPDEVRGWFLLRKLALDRSSEAMILTATQGSLKYDVINKAIKSVFPQGKCTTTATRMKDVYSAEINDDEGANADGGEDDENEVFQVVADSFQNQEQYDDEEVLDVLETYQDIRRKLQQKKMGRGYKQPSSSWSLTGTVKGRLEQLKSKTKCHICKQVGHWKKECPQRRTGAATSTKPRASEAKEAMITDMGFATEDGPEWFIPPEEVENLEVFLVEGEHGNVDIVVAGQGETDCAHVDAVLGGLETGLVSPGVFDFAQEAAETAVDEVHAMTEPIMDEEMEMMADANGVPWRSDLTVTPLMEELMAALKPELTSPDKEVSTIPVKLLDSREDHEDDEPSVPISGTEILSIGKYAKAGQMKTFSEIYTEDKNYVQWIRKFVTTSKPNAKGQSSSSPMMRLRLYIACRDQIKENRIKTDVQINKETAVDFNPPYIDPVKMSSSSAAKPKAKAGYQGTMKRATASNDGSENWEKVEAPAKVDNRTIKAMKQKLLNQMMALQAQMASLEEIETEEG